MTTPPKQTLVRALIAFQAQMPKVNKGNTATVPTKTGGSYRYTYADLADVSDAAIPLLNQNGLAFTCTPRRCDDGNYELVGVLLHDSGESMEGALPLIGRTSQEIGGSITYARRYLLGTMTGIITDDDVDAQDRSAQRTSHPSPLEMAQERVKVAFTLWSGHPWIFDEMATAYESDHDKKIGVATADDLNAWAESLDQQRAARGAQQAAEAAQRALGAQARDLKRETDEQVNP